MKKLLARIKGFKRKSKNQDYQITKVMPNGHTCSYHTLYNKNKNKAIEIAKEKFEHDKMLGTDYEVSLDGVKVYSTKEDLSLPKTQKRKREENLKRAI